MIMVSLKTVGETEKITEYMLTASEIALSVTMTWR